MKKFFKGLGERRVFPDRVPFSLSESVGTGKGFVASAHKML